MGDLVKFSRQPVPAQPQQADRHFHLPVRRFQIVRGVARALGLKETKRRLRGLPADTGQQSGEVEGLGCA